MTLKLRYEQRLSDSGVEYHVYRKRLLGWKLCGYVTGAGAGDSVFVVYSAKSKTELQALILNHYKLSPVHTTIEEYPMRILYSGDYYNNKISTLYVD